METNKQKEERLVIDNMGLVVKIVKFFHPIDMNEYDEYIQVGSIGLLKAIRKYDPGRGTTLSTIAWPYIYYSVLRAFKQNSTHKHEVLFDDAGNVKQPSRLWEFIPNNLTAIERKILVLRLEQNMTFREIGQEIGGYTRGWANKLYKRALGKVQQGNNE